MDNLTHAQARLEEAKSIHAEYLRLHDEMEQHRSSLGAALYSLLLVEVVQARRLADSVKMQADRARELTDRHPKEPPDLSELRQQIQTVGNALSVWDAQPDIVPASSPTSEEIRREISALPPMPDGDTKPHHGVMEAMNALRNARSNLEAHQGGKPGQAPTVATGNLTLHEVRHLASELALEEPVVDPALDKRLQDAQARFEAIRQPEVQQRSNMTTFPLLRPLIGLFRILANLIRRLFRGHKPEVDYEAIAKASEELREAQNAQGEARFNRDMMRRRKQEALDKAIEAGLPADDEELWRIGELLEQSLKTHSEMARWESEEVKLRQAHDEAEDKLRQALESRGVSVEQDCIKAAERYMSDCEQRDSQAQQASRKSELERLLERTREQEAASVDSSQKGHQASKNIEEAALAIERSAGSEKDLVDSLRLWYGEAERLLQDGEKAREEWLELQKLLNGWSIDDLENSAKDRKREAEQMAIGIDEESIGLVDQDEDLEKRLDQHQREVEEAQKALAMKRGQFEQFSRDIPVVAEAEEKVDVAEAELLRVRTLRDTLNKTRELLVSAQDRVHRSLAPVLRDALKPWLSDVTQGRYQDIRVDVESLGIQVFGTGGNWRDASLLSHGTAEQIYLLLRVAMSRYLTKSGETCPLILDDITVNCDSERQDAILSLLHEISGEQQVILFSQERETLEWAQEHLLDTDRLILLEPASDPS